MKMKLVKGAEVCSTGFSVYHTMANEDSTVRAICLHLVLDIARVHDISVALSCLDKAVTKSLRSLSYEPKSLIIQAVCTPK